MDSIRFRFGFNVLVQLITNFFRSTDFVNGFFVEWRSFLSQFSSKEKHNKMRIKLIFKNLFFIKVTYIFFFVNYYIRIILITFKLKISSSFSLKPRKLLDSFTGFRLKLLGVLDAKTFLFKPRFMFVAQQCRVLLDRHSNGSIFSLNDDDDLIRTPMSASSFSSSHIADLNPVDATSVGNSSTPLIGLISCCFPFFLLFVRQDGMCCCDGGALENRLFTFHLVVA